jgi:hypothetical protein
MSDVVRFKDFSLDPEPIGFRIAPDDFECYPEIPLDVMMDVVKASTTQASGPERLEQMLQMLEGVIVDKHYEVFVKRTKRGTKEQPNPSPIGMRHIRDLLPWIMEVYGLRPTEESSESADGSLDEDTSSTDTASPED